MVQSQPQADWKEPIVEIAGPADSLTKNHLSRWYLAVLGGALLLYVISCAPGLLWQDSGTIQYRVWHNDIEGGMGLALAHPLFYILAIATKYIPFGAFAHKVNLIAAIAAALAVANLFLLIRLWLGKNGPALIAAVTFAVSHTFWRHASIAETYTLYIMLLSIELLMLLRYVQTRRRIYLYLLGLGNGLAIANHMLASIPLSCYAVFFVILLIKKHIGFKDLAIIICLWLIGALPYEYLIIKNVIHSGDLMGTLASAAFGDSWQGAVLNTSMSLKIIKENILFFLMNFPTPNILLFFIGCFSLSKLPRDKSFRNILIALGGLFLVFAFRYTIIDRYAFFIPFYFVVSIFIGLGAYAFFETVKIRSVSCVIVIFLFLPICVYAVTPGLAEKAGLNLGTRTIPYRNMYKFFLQPWKTGYRGADKFGNEALDIVEENAIIYADGTTVYPILLTQQLGGKRADVTVVSGHASVNNLAEYGEDVIDSIFDNRPVYVVSPIKGYCQEFLLARYDFVKTGVLYKAIAKTEDVRNTTLNAQ